MSINLFESQPYSKTGRVSVSNYVSDAVECPDKPKVLQNEIIAEICVEEAGGDEITLVETSHSGLLPL